MIKIEKKLKIHFQFDEISFHIRKYRKKRLYRCWIGFEWLYRFFWVNWKKKIDPRGWENSESDDFELRKKKNLIVDPLSVKESSPSRLLIWIGKGQFPISTLVSLRVSRVAGVDLLFFSNSSISFYWKIWPILVWKNVCSGSDFFGHWDSRELRWKM